MFHFQEGMRFFLTSNSKYLQIGESIVKFRLTGNTGREKNSERKSETEEQRKEESHSTEKVKNVKNESRKDRQEAHRTEIEK